MNLFSSINLSAQAMSNISLGCALVSTLALILWMLFVDHSEDETLEDENREI